MARGLVDHGDLAGVDVGVLPDEEEEDLQPVGVQVDGPEELGSWDFMILANQEPNQTRNGLS